MEVNDEQGQDWILDVKDPGNGVVRHLATGNGGQSVVWDGKDDGGVLLPEGKYRFVLKTAARKDFVKHAIPVWIDLTPPVIDWEYKYRPDGRKTLVVKLEDALSGLDLSQTEIEVPGATPLSEPEKTGFPKAATYKYTILDFPVIVADDSNYSIQSTQNQSQATSQDKAGITATIPIGANPNPIPNINENKLNDCWMSTYDKKGVIQTKRKIRFLESYDFDRRQGGNLNTKDITLAFLIDKHHEGSYGFNDYLENLNVKSSKSSLKNLVNYSGPEAGPKEQNNNTENYKKQFFLDQITDGIYNNNNLSLFESDNAKRRITPEIIKKIPGLPKYLGPKQSILFISVNTSKTSDQDQQLSITIPSGDGTMESKINLYLIDAKDNRNNWSGIKCNGG